MEGNHMDGENSLGFDERMEEMEDTATAINKDEREG